MQPVMSYIFKDVYETVNFKVTEVHDGISRYYLIGPKESLYPIFGNICRRLKNEIGRHIFSELHEAKTLVDKAQREYDYTVSAI